MGDVDRIRAHRVLARLRTVAADLSGYEASELSETATFLELGFDSLFLTQLATEFQREYGIRITFRQLFDELPSLRALAQYIDRQLPAETASPAAAPAAAASDAPVPAGSGRATPVATASASEANGSPSSARSSAPAAAFPAGQAVAIAAAPTGLQGVMAQQLALMSQQIQLLRSLRGDVTPGQAPAASEPMEGPAGQDIERATDSRAADTAPDAQPPAEPPPLPRGFGPGSSRGGGALTRSQRDHIQRLTARYNARTAGSKASTQAHRPHHADPRTAAGFNRQWKEMVYPIVIDRSSGSTLQDIDGNHYIDILNGFGPNFLGHSPPFVSEALKAQIDRGIEVGPQTPLAGEAAQLFCELTGMDRVSWVNTGSEAVQAAIRLSRTYTGRSRIVVFSGDYHGNFDEVLVRATGTAKGSRRTVPLAPGIPLRAVEDVLVLDYGADESLDLIREHASDIAAVLVEPVQSRRPEFQPREFLHKLRELTTREGIVLVFDEVITGFRICPGGAQEYYGVQADLATYGKIIGGGMPIGVVAGRARFMDTFDGGQWQYGDDSFPSAGVTFFAGTFVRHPLAIAAVHATLQYLKAQGPRLQEAVNRRTTRLTGELNAFFQQRGVKIHIPHFASQMFIRVQEEGELATLLFYHLRDRGIHVLEGFPSYMTASHTDADVDRIIAAFKDSVYEMQADGVLPLPAAETAAQLPWRRTLPLTAGQREIWAASQMGEMASCAFNESDSVLIRGPLDNRRFAEAVVRVLGEQEAFRYRFDSDGSTQWVDSQANYEMPVIDLSGLDEAARRARQEALIDQQALTPFDLEHGPLVRVNLLKLGSQEHLFLIYSHHIVFDGYSSELLMRQIARAYGGAETAAGDEGIAAVPYSVFIHRTERRGAAAEESMRYWLQKLADPPAPVELPTDRPRGARRGYRGATLHRQLDPELSRGLRETAKALNTTLYVLLLAGFQALVSRLSNQEDLVIGVPVAGQARLNVETVGYCVNALPIRAAPELGKSFDALIGEIQRDLLDAFDHQDTSLGEIVAALDIARDPSRLPLVEIIFNYSSYFADLELEGCTIAAHENRRRAVYHDMFLHVGAVDGELVIAWDYCSDLFDAATMARWADHYSQLLGGVVADSRQAIGDLPLLSPPAGRGDHGDVEASVDDAPRPTGELPSGGPEATVDLSGYRVDQMISEQVARTPHATAVVHEQVSLTYLELERQSDRVAARLRALGVGRGTLVGIHLERSLEMVVVLIAVMKAGGAYVPLDPDFPANRLAFMVSDAGIELLVTDRAQSHSPVPAPPGSYREIALSALVDAAADEAPALDHAEVDAAGGGDLVYVLYTSGSTGTPKGVAVEHRNVANFLIGMQQRPGMTSRDRLIAVTTLSFDIAALELYLPLVTGACVVIASRDEAADGARLSDMIEIHQASVLQATPTTWRLLIDAGWQGSDDFKALCGGEPMPPDLAQLLLQRCGELWNLYGPTETAIWSAAFRVVDGEAPALIGRPILNTRIYVLDHAGRPVPTGIPGELFIAGAGVARGYLNRPELTDERFVPDPFCDDVGGRMYRTGDLGRYLPDGNLEYRSRVDTQVKIRGFRVELGEIEAALESHPMVKQAVASILEPRPGDLQLVGYVVPNAEAPEPSQLRDHLRARLPHYMVPRHVAVVGKFPLTPNGKIDRNALPAPDPAAAAPSSTASAPPVPHADPRVNYLVAVWTEVLGVAAGPQDNFFDLGGYSMLAVQMVNRVAVDTGVRLKLVRLGSLSLEQIAQDLPDASDEADAVTETPLPGVGFMRSAKRMFAARRPRE